MAAHPKHWHSTARTIGIDGFEVTMLQNPREGTRHVSLTTKTAAEILTIAARRSLAAFTEEGSRVAEFYRTMARNIDRPPVDRPADIHLPTDVRRALVPFKNDWTTRTAVNDLMAGLVATPQPSRASARQYPLIVMPESLYGAEIDRCIKASPTLTELHSMVMRSGVPVHLVDGGNPRFLPQRWLGREHTEWGESRWGLMLPRRGAESPGNFGMILGHEYTHVLQFTETPCFIDPTGWKFADWRGAIVNIKAAQEVDAFTVGAVVGMEIKDKLGEQVFQRNFFDGMNAEIIGVLKNFDADSLLNYFDAMKEVTPFNHSYLWGAEKLSEIAFNALRGSGA